MPTFKEQIEIDLSVFFDDTTLAEPAQLNAVPVPVAIVDAGTEEDATAMYDYLDTMIRKSDYQTIDYRSDALVLFEKTWRHPKQTAEDDIVRTVRWRRNEKPVMS